MQERNPYVPTRVPLLPEEGSASALGVVAAADIVYGGFWRRFGAQFIDGVILLPLTLGTLVAINYSRMAYAYLLVPTVLIGLFYSIYLVSRFGGTPGKLLLKMRIVMTDGSAITTQAATLRYAVMALLSALSSAALAIASRQITDDAYMASSYLEKINTLSQLSPPWKDSVNGVIGLWVIASVVVMLCNRRRRTVHDFIARSVVVRTDQGG